MLVKECACTQSWTRARNILFEGINQVLLCDLYISALLALCEGNPPVDQKGQWRGALVFSLGKQSGHQSFETQSRLLGRHCNVTDIAVIYLGLTDPRNEHVAPLCFVSLCINHQFMVKFSSPLHWMLSTQTTATGAARDENFVRMLPYLLKRCAPSVAG